MRRFLIAITMASVTASAQTFRMNEAGYFNAGGAYDEHEGCKLAFAFSGATSEEDLVVAKYGIERMKGYISNQQEADTTTYSPLATPLKKEQFIQLDHRRQRGRAGCEPEY